MNVPRVLIFFVAAGLALFAGSASAQQPPTFGDGHPVTVGTDASAKYYDFKSTINDRTYRVFVSIPDGAPPKDGFPVVYFLDGNRIFAMASESVSGRSHGHLKPVVVVGIGYPTNHFGEWLSERTKDLTTPISADRLKRLRELSPHGYGQAPDAIGGMDDFLRVIEQEVKPFIDNLAPINSHEQALFGHSLGGLTVVHALFTEPTAFQTFIAASPSIWWDDRAVLRDESSFAREVMTRQVEPRVLIEVGSLEQYVEGLPPGASPSEARQAQMVSNAVNLGKRLAKLKGGPHYVVKTVVFAGESHMSVVPAAMSRALGFGLDAASLGQPVAPAEPQK